MFYDRLQQHHVSKKAVICTRESYHAKVRTRPIMDIYNVNGSAVEIKNLDRLYNEVHVDEPWSAKSTP